MPRNPATPDCGITGCKRAEYRLGVCRHHQDLLPEHAGFDLMVACLQAQFRVKSKHIRAAVRAANEKRRSLA